MSGQGAGGGSGADQAGRRQAREGGAAAFLWGCNFKTMSMLSIISELDILYGYSYFVQLLYGDLTMISPTIISNKY